MPWDAQTDRRGVAAGFASESLRTAAAFVGGAYAVRRFQAVPLSRQRETLEAMQKQYASTGEERAIVLPQFPPLVRMGRDACLGAAEATGSHCPSSTLRALQLWPEPTITAAHEVLESEAKFRSMLWAVLRVRDASGGDAAPQGMGPEVFKSIDALVRKLNDFTQLMELGLFAESDVLGLLHRSIAPACKAVEPVIWSRNASGGRWGLRLLRLRLRAEHFNDVRAIHASSPLMWRGQETRPVCVHEALYRPVFDRFVPTDRLAHMTVEDRARLRWEKTVTQLRPRFGGDRLRRHVASENRLAGSLRYAVSHALDPLDFSWSMQVLRDAMQSHHEKTRNADPP